MAFMMDNLNLSEHFTPIISLFFIVVVVIIVILVFARRRFINNGQKDHLPPGSLGWPYIGETLQLYTQHPNTFLSTRQHRYGEIFKTHVLGCPCVMVASPEAARFVLKNRANLFRPTYPKSKENLIGRSALFFHQGQYHARLRRLVQASMSTAALRRLSPDIEAAVASALSSWADAGGIINTFKHMKKLSFEVGVLATFGYLEDHYKEELKKNYIIMDKGYNSFPTNFPGTKYHSAIKARKRLSEILRHIARERRNNNYNTAEKNLLDCLLTSGNGGGGGGADFLSEDQVADNVIGVLFAAQDTTASSMTWILKYLHDNPKVFEAVKAEHTAIYESNENGTNNLSWNQIKDMTVTHKVIMESLRMASVISFTFREAVADVEYKGYLIQKGWKVLPLFRNIHYDRDLFPDPHKFDPSRFQYGVKGETFLAFGSGVHACPGNQLAKLEMLVFVHHLTSRFRYELVGCESGVEYSPFPVPLHGLPATFSKLPQPQE
ncbi:abscisic acid 8'-hydroxylase CYP707A1-like [Andrographis paniculata]|uniref:abscisic acid 8'-hydroxylase CYP707A1-like n=1 Tax=Andrographis paniculata TaxID=175694 RepID=UPI0021E87273|nr:abscisic acid 8'-hydroxylase CYP707A1-like [Andrographis paniculata]